MDFGESLAPISQVDVVSCRSDVLVIYRLEILSFTLEVDLLENGRNMK